MVLNLETGEGSTRGSAENRGGSGTAVRDWMLVALFTAVGIGLRLAYLLRVPPFLDEYSSMLTGMGILRTGGLPELPSGVLYTSGSLFSYLEALFIGLFGFSDFSARLPSLLLGGLTLPVLYLLVRNLLNRRVALLSVALLALTPEAIVWGGRARMYALLQFLVLLTVYFFYHSVLHKKAIGRQRTMLAGLWVACFLAAIFAQDEAILLLPVLWLAALVLRGPGWFFKPSVLLGQVLLPVLGVVARFWLNKIRVPGEVYTLVHDSYLRFPPALAHGLQRIAPFFTGPSVWFLSILFFLALGFLARWGLVRGKSSEVALTHAREAPQLLAPGFLAYVVVSIAAAIVLVVNEPWQGARYMFMVLPLYLMVACWGLDQLLEMCARRWSILRGEWITIVLVVLVGVMALPGALSTTKRLEPDYSAAFRWVATQLGDQDLIAALRPAPAAVYLGRSDYLVAEDKHQEFIMRLDGVWVDRWAGAKVIESPDDFRDLVLDSGRPVWFVVDEDRFESASYSPEFVALIMEQMDLVWRDGGVLVFRGQGYHPLPVMGVERSQDASFDNQLRLTGYALSTDQPAPGDSVVLQLSWQAIEPERNYTVFVHVVGADDQGLTQVDGQPFLGLYDMTTHWPRDRSVTDTRHLIVPPNAAPGHYRIEVGLYDGDDPGAGPLPLLDSGGSEIGDRLILDYLHVDVSPPPGPAQLVTVANLGGVVRLVGYEPPPPVQIAAGQTLLMTLTWECLMSMTEDYTIFIHLVGNDSLPQAQADGPPLGGSYPTSAWDKGDHLATAYSLMIPVELVPGDYELRVGMYIPDSGERLPLLDADDHVLGDFISLGTVKVLAPTSLEMGTSNG